MWKGQIKSCRVVNVRLTEKSEKWFQTFSLQIMASPYYGFKNMYQNETEENIGNKWLESWIGLENHGLGYFIGWWKWQPTPVFLPGEYQGWGSVVGCHLCGHTEWDTTEVT